MKLFDAASLTGMSRFQRANLINCISGTKPAILIGTISSAGVTNLALFSSVFHLGADPSLVGFVQRPLTEFSHTYKNIIETGQFTINQIPARFAAQAHHTSAKFADGVSEFKSCGFEEVFSPGILAPFVKESPVRAAMIFRREVHLPENDTRIMIGEVVNVIAEEGLVREDGNIDPEGFDPLGTYGLETYFKSAVIGRFAYAKPGIPPEKV